MPIRIIFQIERSFLSLVMVWGLFFAFSPSPSAEAEGTAKAHRPEKSTTAKVKRIVPLSWDAAEIIRALGKADAIAAVNSTVADDEAFWPNLSKAPMIGHAFNPNCEAIVKIRPDLVVAYKNRPDAAFDERMKAFGVPVLRLDCFRPGEVEDDIRFLGSTLDADEKAEELVTFIDKWRTLVTERVAAIPDSERPRVYLEGYRAFKGSGGGTGGNILCSMAGGRNVVANLKTRYPTVSSEWLLKENPDIVVKAVSTSAKAGGYDDDDRTAMKAIHEELTLRPGWDGLAAVKNDKVYLVSASSWLGPAYVVALARMAKWFHPEKFADIDPTVIHKEYLRRFHGLSETGVQYYP